MTPQEIPPCKSPDAIDGEHEWEFQDDSFDHEYGTERVWYFRCVNKDCAETKLAEPDDYDDGYF